MIIFCYAAGRAPFKETKCGLKHNVKGFHSGVGRRNLILQNWNSLYRGFYIFRKFENLEGREETESVMRQKETWNCLNLCYPVASVQAYLTLIRTERENWRVEGLLELSIN